MGGGERKKETSRSRGVIAIGALFQNNPANLHYKTLVGCSCV